MLVALSKLIEARDPFMRGHGARVAALANPVARKLGWDAAELETLAIGAALHDVGKLRVPRRILAKTDALDRSEVAQIRTHPTHGAAVVAAVPAARAALPYVLHHHERWDGRGYPHGLRGAEIPAEARLLAIADAFDAMTSVRAYRAALTGARALSEIHRCAGSQFDPEVARAFVEVWRTVSRAAAG